MQGIDIKLFFLINHGTANTLFDVLMPFLTFHGYLLILPYIIYILSRGIKGRTALGKSYLTLALWAVVISFCSTFVAEMMEYVLKYSVARVRPCHVLEGVKLLTLCPEEYSMPSGHAVSSFAFATPLLYLTRGFIPLVWRLYPVILAALVAFSRVYAGVHYPSDVIMGALLGIVVSMLLSTIYVWIQSRRPYV